MDIITQVEFVRNAHLLTVHSVHPVDIVSNALMDIKLSMENVIQFAAIIAKTINVPSPIHVLLINVSQDISTILSHISAILFA